ncbi:transport protein DltB [Streptococcus pneumoniae]|nr:transport protein DltB [Streptococcus pneumoniae]
MMEFFQQLPHLEPYGNPQYFVYVIAATLPIFIGLFFKKRFAWYEVLVSLFFIVTMLVGGKTNQLAALGIYLCWEILLLLFYKHYRKSKDGKWVFYLVSFLSLLPIIFVGGWKDQSTSCLGYLPLLGNIAPAFLQALSKKQGWQVGLLLS